MSLRQVFFKDSVIYGLSSYLSLIAAFVLTPIYTRIFSKEDYGIMDLCSTWNNFFILIIPLGLSTAILRMYHDFNDDDHNRNKNLGTLLVTLFFTSSVYLLIIFVFSKKIIGSYYKTDLDKNIYYLSVGIVIFTVLTAYFQTLNRIQFKKYIFLSINLLIFLIIATLGYVLVVIFKHGIIGFFIASFIATGAGSLLSLILGRKDIYFSFDYNIFKKTIAYSVPLLLVLIFIRFTFIVDRMIINNMLDLKSIGEYSIIMRIGNVFQMFIGAFTAAWFPYAMSIINNNDRNKIYRKGFEYYLIIFSILAFIIMLFNKEIILFFAPNYLNIESIVYVIIPTTLLGGASYFVGLGIHIAKKTVYFIYSSLISFIVNVLSSILLVKYFGLMGVALGSFLAILTWVVVEYYFSLKLETIRFKIFMLIIVFIVLFFLGFLIQMFNQFVPNFSSAISIKLTTVILLSGIAFFNAKFRNIIVGAIKNI